MKTFKNKSARVLLFASAFVLLSAVGLLWTVVVRETERKDLLLEYEAFRASSAVVDEYRRDQTFTPEIDARIIGFGFYRLDGTAVQRYGSAPETISDQTALRAERQGNRNGDLPGSVTATLSPDKKSIRLLRSLGLQNPARMMDPEGNAPGMGMGMGLGRGRQNPSAAQQGVPPAQAASPGALFGLGGSYFTWMEYSTNGFSAERLQFFLVAAMITAALVALFIVLILVFRHNEDLQTREMETRELVQLGEAARTLVHEIKNPLGIMRIQTAKIRRAALPAASAVALPAEDGAARRFASLTESADIIEGEIIRLSGMADRIREFLKSGPARCEKVDLVQFLSSFCGRYKDLAESGVDISSDIPAIQTGEAATVIADPEKLLIALDNILRNAIEALDGLPADRKHVIVRLSRREGFWAIAVVDSGDGVPPDVQKRMFDPFFTTKEKGSGIGLALSKRLVESFGATLTYEAGEKGLGAVFIVTLKGEKAPQD